MMLGYVKNRQLVLFHRHPGHPPPPQSDRVYAQLMLAPGGDEIARVDDFDMPEHHMMLGYVKNRQPVLFHRHPGQS